MPEETPEEKATREAAEAEEKRKKEEKIYTEDELQARLNRIGSSEKKDGRRAREAEIIEELGIKDLAEAKEIISKVKKADDDSKDNLQKEREELQREQAKTAEANTKALAERVNAAGERALIRAGLTFPEKADETEKDKIINRALRSLGLDPSQEPDGDTIVKAVEDLKKDVPSFFSPAKEPDPAKPVPSDLGGPPAKIPVSDAAKAAQAQLHRLHPELAEKA